MIVSRSWLVMLDRSGRTVSRVLLRVGDQVSASSPLLECDQQPPIVVSEVDTTAAHEIRPGDTAVGSDDQTNRSVALTVTRVNPGIADAPTSGGTIHLRPTEPVTGLSSGQELRITVAAQATAHPVLVAPVTGIVTDAAADSSVILVGRGARRRVPVRLGICAQGYCQVAAVTGALHEGDEILLLATP